MQPEPQMGDVISGAIVGFWAFLGAIMRGATDWRDPKTGKISVGRLGASLATALVLGQIASILGTYWKLEPYLINGIASITGYLGPAATMQLFQQRIFGAKNDLIPAIPPVKD